jgi:surface protein
MKFQQNESKKELIFDIKAPNGFSGTTSSNDQFIYELDNISHNITPVDNKFIENVNLGYTNLSEMFRYCSNLTTLNLSNFDTHQVTNMSGMFSYCSILTTLNLSNFDTNQVTDMNGMFSNCSNLTTLDLSNFDTHQVTYMNSMFSNCSNLTTLNLSTLILIKLLI